MSGQSRIINAQMARPETPKGSALKGALTPSKINNALKNVMGNEKQPIKK